MRSENVMSHSGPAPSGSGYDDDRTSNVFSFQCAQVYTWNICVQRFLSVVVVKFSLFVTNPSSVLCFSGRHVVHHALDVSVVNDTGRALHFIVAVLHSSRPPQPNPAASLLRGLCMNSHCHVQGRVAQGQLIAFMIMISRQIYCACSEHIFQVLPTLLAQMGKMSLQLRAVTSCLSAGHTFWLISWMHGVNHAGFSCKSLFFFVIAVLAFLIFLCPSGAFFFFT